MRISDWSSDVCSSDLGRIGTFAACRDGLVQERVAGNSATTCIETTCAQLGPGATGCRRPLRGDAGDVQFAAPIMGAQKRGAAQTRQRSEEHTSELQSLMRTSSAAFCLKKKNTHK